MSISQRIDAITAIPEAYRHEVIPAPKSCKIELTSNCSLRCSFCDNVNLKNKGEMKWEDFTILCDDLRAVGVEELGVFYIGESMMLDWLADAVRYAKEVAGFPYVFLTTNGQNTTPEKLEAVMAAGLDSLKFSINFADAEQFAEVARVKPKLFRKALDSIKDARRIRDEGGYACKLYASSIKFDGEQAAKMQVVIDEILPFLDEHYFLPLFSFGSDRVTEREGELGLKPVAGNPGRADMMREPLPCWAVFTEMHIDRYGNLNACCFGGDSFIMGNGRRQGVMEVWNNEEFQSLRRAHLARDVTGTPCEHCALGG
jgi:radical SAM protein with 4Fe4S-binding SPASM domain